MTKPRTRWTLVMNAPTIYVPARKSGQPKPAGGWPLKAAAGWITMNGAQGSWRKRDNLRKEWQALAAAAALVARLPRGQVTVARFDAVLRFSRVVRRDTTNWHPTVKVVIDSLTKGTKTHPGWGFLPDDSPRFLHCEDCPHLRIGTPFEAAPGRPLGVLELTITALSGASDG
jgi:hypothetical protein